MTFQHEQFGKIIERSRDEFAILCNQGPLQRFGERLARRLGIPCADQCRAKIVQPMTSSIRSSVSRAIWREEVVQWVYVDSPRASVERQVVLLDRYAELCAVHTRWLLSPSQLGIPLLCTELDEKNRYFAAWGLRDPLQRLDQITIAMSPDAYSGQSGTTYVSYPGQTVAVAILIEFAVATYGRERLPALVAGLGQYDRWDTLLPAVYGVSSVEFEAGWQAYLTAHYGL